jgi:glucokinase
MTDGNPDRVTGPMVAAGDRLLDPARDALRRTLVGAAHRRVPDVLAAELGPQAGMIGGALLVS